MTNDKTIKETLTETTNSIMNTMGFDFAVEILENGAEEKLTYVISVQSQDDLGMLIGKNGQNIKALEHVIRAIVYKKLPENTNFILDINNYRKSRANYLIEQARTAAVRVKESNKPEAMLPMSSYERRLIHVELAPHTNVLTESIGKEPNRRIVIKPLL